MPSIKHEPLAPSRSPVRLLTRILLSLALITAPILSAIAGEPRQGGPAGVNPPGFVLPIDDRVLTAAVQADGKILIGGYFHTVGDHPRSLLARFHADGSLDLDFAPVLNGTLVYAITLQRDGRILVGGGYDSIDVDGVAVVRKGIARLNNDGSLDTGFTPLLDGAARGMFEQPDGRILISGSFDHVDGQTRRSLARLHASGALDTGFAVPIVGEVHALTLQSDGRIVIGGNLLYIHDELRRNLARLMPDGALDADFTPESALAISALAVQGDDKILVGSGGLYRLNADGSDDSSFRKSSNGSSYSLVTQENGSIVAAGTFAAMGGQQRQYLARVDADGFAEAEPGLLWPDAAVHGVMLLPDGDLLVFGAFTEFLSDGSLHSRIARLPAVVNSTQTLDVTPDNRSALWQRGGSLPTLGGLQLELSTDELEWSDLGDATRVTGGWLFEQLELPRNTDFVLRASGRAAGGYVGGSVSRHYLLSEEYLLAFDVTPLVTTGVGTVTPAIAQQVDQGRQTVFIPAPGVGHSLGPIESTCGDGELAGGVYTTALIHADCTVEFNFLLNRYTVSASAAAHGTIGPASQMVEHGATGTLTVEADPNHHLSSINGDTCSPVESGSGSWSTGAISADCAIGASFAIDTYTVTATASGNGTITPASQTVDHGTTAQVTVTPASGYFAENVHGNTCTLSDNGNGVWSSPAILTDCAITAHFASIPLAQLAITLDNTPAYARYGTTLDYLLTVRNDGDGDATGVHVGFLLPPGIDAAHTSWTCFGGGAGAHCVEAGEGALDDAKVAIPAGRNLSWRITAPVRTDAAEATIDVSAQVSHLGATSSQTGSTTLVLLRNGFEPVEMGLDATGLPE